MRIFVAALCCLLLVAASDTIGKFEKASWFLVDALLRQYPETSPTPADQEAAKGLLKSLAHFYPRPDLKQLFAADGLGEQTASREALSRYVCELKNLLGLTAPDTSCDSYYLPLPGAAVKKRGSQKGSCELGEDDINEWLQGQTTLRSGAMTLLLFVSQSCDVCHEVIPKIDRLYRQYRLHGLNVIGIHSGVKGHRSTEQERQGMLAYFREEQVSFPLVDMTFKSGLMPIDEQTGYPNWKAAAKQPVKKASLYRRLFDEMEFVTPLAYIMKNCQPLMEQPLDSYSILSLDASLARAAAASEVGEGPEAAMLWPPDLRIEYADPWTETESTAGHLGAVASTEINGEDEDDDEDEESEDREWERRRRRRHSRTDL